MLHRTDVGYVAVPAGQDDEKKMIRPPAAVKWTRFAVIVLSALTFLVYYVWYYGSPPTRFEKPYVELVGGILGLIMLSAGFWERWVLKRRLRKYDRENRLILLPQRLVLYAYRELGKLERPMPDNLFDYDMTASRLLADLFAKHKKQRTIEMQVLFMELMEGCE